MIRKKRLTAKQRDLRRYKVKAKCSIGALRSTVDRKAEKAEKLVIEQVRAACVVRDGYCRMRKDDILHRCCGESEWAHLRPFTRAQTRGMAPAERHRTTHSMMLCTEAHRAYDAGELRITVSYDPGANGYVVFSWA